jgi:hypothetical protein
VFPETERDTDMTIKTQAYLQGYLHEKTAAVSLFDPNGPRDAKGDLNKAIAGRMRDVNQIIQAAKAPGDYGEDDVPRRGKGLSWYKKWRQEKGRPLTKKEFRDYTFPDNKNPVPWWLGMATGNLGASAAGAYGSWRRNSAGIPPERIRKQYADKPQGAPFIPRSLGEKIRMFDTPLRGSGWGLDKLYQLDPSAAPFVAGQSRGHDVWINPGIPSDTGIPGLDMGLLKDEMKKSKDHTKSHEISHVLDNRLGPFQLGNDPISRNIRSVKDLLDLQNKSRSPEVQQDVESFGIPSWLAEYYHSDSETKARAAARKWAQGRNAPQLIMEAPTTRPDLQWFRDWVKEMGYMNAVRKLYNTYGTLDPGKAREFDSYPQRGKP